MSKSVTMYEENKPSTLSNDVQKRLNFFRAILVRSAMPNNSIIIILQDRTRTVCVIRSMWVGIASEG